jgi:AraC-like DNA-binding protein
VIFWLFARALFDDDFRPQPWHAAPWLGIVGLALTCALALRPHHSPLAEPIDSGLAVTALGFAGLAVVQTCSSWSADLVAPRRRLRVVIVAACAGYIILNALSGLLGLQRAAPNDTSFAEAAGLAAITAVIAWSFLGVAGGDALFAEADVKANVVAAPADVDPADRILLTALERTMSFERLYRREGLTIGALAHALGAPEHRLRRLINQGLGHRNFNRYLNGYRVADAQAGLADPAQAEVSILTIAMDAGFNSLGPFNRAFKDETGVTPSEYRQRALSAAAESRPRSISAGRIPKSA